MIDPLAAVGAIGGLVGVLSMASTKWRGANRSERNDHQACLEKLAAHIERSNARSDEHDVAISHIREQHESCQEHLGVLRDEVASLRKLHNEIKRSISPPPFPRSKG